MKNLAILAALTLAPVAASAAPTSDATHEVAPRTTHAPVSATPDVTSTYAQRETTSQKAQQFNGGDVVVVSITGGALLLILLILLLI